MCNGPPKAHCIKPDQRIFTPGRCQSKMLILSTNVDQRLLETEFLIAICRLTSDKCQSKTLFQAIFYLHLSIVKSVFDCCLSDVILVYKGLNSYKSGKNSEYDQEIPQSQTADKPVAS